MDALNRTFQGILLASLVMVAGCAGARIGAEDTEWIGLWVGEVTEGDLQYDLLMDIDRLEQDGFSGTTSYTGVLSCGGDLTLDSRAGDTLVFIEAIDDVEKCADGGSIEIRMLGDGRIEWRWFEEGAEGAAAHATLHRM